MKAILWIACISAMLALPYVVTNRGWDTIAAIGALLIGFAYNQIS